MNSIEEQICEAIDIIVNKAVAQANYDKTIQATVVCCVDATIGKYKVRYQDSTFYAYSTNSDITYTDGAVVYVLIPGNDIDIDKTILGTVKKLGINYVATVEDDEAYEVIGNNVISSTAVYGLSSYRQNKYVKTLYDKSYTPQQNLGLNTKALEEYIRNAESIICGATFRTELAVEQQFRGNYGIVFALDFKDNTKNSEVTRYYTVDVDSMKGNPYKTLHDTRQYKIFDIDGKNFLRVSNISIFCYDFPNNLPDAQCVDDIFVSNIELCAAARLSNDDINSYSLTFLTLKGTYFDESSLDSDTRTIDAQVRVKGKVIDNESQKLPFYWFTEHVGITSESEYYNKYGGQGWKCLNQHNIIKPATATDPAIVEWIPASHLWTVKKSDIIAKEVRYKCAVVYDGTVITKIITIKNLASRYEISISSDCGTKFYFDDGFPTLTCSIKEGGREKNGCSFSWAVTNNVGNFENIVDTPEINSAYQLAYNEYNNLLNDIQAERLPLEPWRQELERRRIELVRYDRITRVDGKTIHHLNVNTITDFSTYQCTVYYGNMYLGTASIVFSNSLTAEGAYSLVIHDSSKVYKYNENGVSPACSAVDSPIDIQALTFSVYDNLGNRIDDEVVRHSNIRWVVPFKDTMIKIPNIYSDYEEDEERGVRIYKNLMSFAYEIEDRFDITATNNDIEVLVDYQGMSLSNKTDLVFVKEGDAGTNGTEFVCRIIPNIVDGTKMPAYPMVTENYYHAPELNFTARNSTQWFRVQLWHNEDKIFDAVQSGLTKENKQANVKWEILKNQYKTDTFDPSAVGVDVNGRFSFYGYKYGESAPANIVKATIEYDGVTYYATIPLVTAIIKNLNYRISRKANSGFSLVVYSSDGQRPRYDNTNPFEAIVEQKIGGYWEDVSQKITSAYAVTYDWKCNIGSIYEDNRWKNTPMLEVDRVNSAFFANQYVVKPADAYDGQCVTNAVEVTVKRNGTEICRMHMPVQMMLNRYGNSAINGWDGNSIQVDNEGGFILAPQVGAGKKNNDNSFTGVVMGKVKETNESTEDIGLLGYSKGVRSFFLDSDDGSAIFGTKNNGKLIIDPSQSKAMLYSWNYWKQYNKKGKPNGYSSSNVANKGMLINLTDSYIHFGSAESGKLYSGEHTALNSTQDGFYLSHDGLSIGKDFVIATDGSAVINHDGSDIGNWKVKYDSDGNLVGLVSKSNSGILLDSKSSTIVLGSSAGKIYSGSHITLDNDSNGFYLSNSGLSIGSGAYFSQAGVLRVGYGAVKGNANSNYWTIANEQLTNDDGTKTYHSYIKFKNMNDNNSVYISTKMISLGKKFYVDNTGVMRIGHDAVAAGSSGRYWTIDGDAAKAYIGYKATKSEITTSSSVVSIGDDAKTTSVYLGTDGIRLGKKFGVDANGNVLMKYLTASGGTIGGWAISSDRLTSQKASGAYIEIKSDGTIHTQGTADDSGWSITRNGSATFKNITANGKGNIGGATLANGKLTVHTAQIEDAAITTAKIANAAITTAKIGDAQITNAKIADATIQNAKIVDATITNAKIANLTITGSKIAGSTITGAKIANATITGAKIAAATIEGSNIKGGTITGAKIADATIENAHIKGKITADHIDVTDLSVTNSVNIGGSTHYLRMGKNWTKNPEVSGLNIGSQGIKVNGDNYGQSLSSVQFVSNITGIDIGVSKTLGVLTGVSVTISYNVRKFTTTSGILTGLTNSEGKSHSDSAS